MEPIKLTTYTAREMKMLRGVPTATGETRQYATVTRDEAVAMLLEDERKRWQDEHGDADAWRVNASGTGIMRGVFSEEPLAWYVK